MLVHEPSLPRVPRRFGAPALLIACVAVGIVLRVWALGASRLSFDETFTAVAARMPLGAMISYLWHADAHPPLDYLLRRPLALSGASDGWFRAPSVLLSLTALVVAWRWWRQWGRTGTIALALLAISSYAVTYAHDARMYAGLGLAGVAVGASATRWLARPTRAALVAVFLGLEATLLLQGGALLVLPAVLALPGLRRDRAAWEWRATVVLAAAVWAALWGRAFVEQLGRTGHSWVPLTTMHYGISALNELVDDTPFLAPLVCLMAIAGACMLPGALRRVTVVLGGGTLATYLVVGTHFHVLLPRALAFGAWAPLVSLAALMDGALRRSRALGATTGALLAVVMLPSSLHAAQPVHAPHAAAFSAVRRLARPGDEVVITPAFLWTMPAWYFGVRWWPHGALVTRPDLAGEGTVIDGARPDGRVWLVVSTAYTAHTAGLPSCLPPQRLDGFTVYCLRGSPSGT